MRRLRLFEYISLDGVIEPEAPGVDDEYVHGGWTAPYRSPEGAAAIAEAQGSAFDLLLGRRTYDLWAGYWPKVKGGLFADPINAAMKYVVTHRAESLAWGPAEALADDIAARVRQVKSGAGPDLIVWGSASLVLTLLDHGLVDEIVLAVYPLLLGRGKRCFSEVATTRTFVLATSQATPTGVLMNTYRIASIGGVS